MKTIQEAINHCRERSANARSKECQCDHLELLGWLEELIVLRASVERLREKIASRDRLIGEMFEAAEEGDGIYQPWLALKRAEWENLKEGKGEVLTDAGK